jgi:hypothetical protein
MNHNTPVIIVNRKDDGSLSSIVINQRDWGEIQGVSFWPEDIKYFAEQLARIPEIKQSFVPDKSKEPSQ